MTCTSGWNSLAITTFCIGFLCLGFGGFNSVNGQAGLGQGTGLNTGGFGTGTGTNTGFGTGTGNTGFGTGTGTGIGTNNDLGGLFGGAMDFGNAGDQETSTGAFVGSSISNRPETGFVGPTAESVGSSAGGAGGGIGGGRTGLGGANRGGGAGGGQGGQGQNGGMTVSRVRQVRTRVVPNFQARPVSTFQQSSRINRRLSFMPRVRTSGSVSVSVRGGTAFLNGNVRNSAQARAIENQLRLEPGVRRIVNQTQVRGF